MNQSHNLQAIKACLEGLKRLDDWEDSQIKQSLIETRNSLGKSFGRIPSLRMQRSVMYADPWGNEISMFEWAVVSESCGRHVGEDSFTFKESADIRISTVWLGLNHGWNGSLMIFETMIFGPAEIGELNQHQERYSTLAEALEGHKVAVGMVINFLQENGKIKDGKVRQSL